MHSFPLLGNTPGSDPMRYPLDKVWQLRENVTLTRRFIMAKVRELKPAVAECVKRKRVAAYARVSLETE